MTIILFIASDTLTLTTFWTNSANDKHDICPIFHKVGFDILCKLNLHEMSNPILLKNERIFQNTICWIFTQHPVRLESRFYMYPFLCDYAIVKRNEVSASWTTGGHYKRYWWMWKISDHTFYYCTFYEMHRLFFNVCHGVWSRCSGMVVLGWFRWYKRHWRDWTE